MQHVTLLSLLLLFPATCKTEVKDCRPNETKSVEHEQPLWEKFDADLNQREEKDRSDADKDSSLPNKIATVLVFNRRLKSFHPLSHHMQAEWANKRAHESHIIKNAPFHIGAVHVPQKEFEQVLKDVLFHKCTCPVGDLEKAKCKSVQASLQLFQKMFDNTAAHEDFLEKRITDLEWQLQATGNQSLELDATVQEKAGKKFQEILVKDRYYCSQESQSTTITQ